MAHLADAIQIAEDAGQELYRHFRAADPAARGTSKEISSVLDHVADEIILGRLRKQYPDHSYLTEETGFVSNGGEYLWIIDPLDGTGNFENHNPFFAVSIALWKGDNPLLAVVEAPALQERFTAECGKGAWRHDMTTGREEQMRTSEIADVGESYIMYCEGEETDRRQVANMFSTLCTNAKEVRKLGAAALECAWVAAGRAEAYIVPSIPLWDVAAGLLLITEAGGELFRLDSGEELPISEARTLHSLNLLATNNHVEVPLV